MKKLLILAMVLGLISTANAALVDGMSIMVAYGSAPGVAPDPGDYFDPVDTELWLAPSDTLWIGIHNSIQGVPGQTQQGIFYMGLGVSATASWTGNWNQYVPPLVAGCPDNEYYGILPGYYFGLPYDLDTWKLTLTNGIPDAFNGIGVLDAKELHCDAEPSDEYVSIYDENLELIDAIVIHQIPEPATIALLGLGGLLLRRKK